MMAKKTESDLKKEIKKLKYELESEKVLSKGHCGNYNDLRSEHSNLSRKNDELALKLARAYEYKMKYELMMEVHLSVITELFQNA